MAGRQMAAGLGAVAASGAIAAWRRPAGTARQGLSYQPLARESRETARPGLGRRRNEDPARPRSATHDRPDDPAIREPAPQPCGGSLRLRALTFPIFPAPLARRARKPLLKRKGAKTQRTAFSCKSHKRTATGSEGRVADPGRTRMHPEQQSRNQIGRTIIGHKERRERKVLLCGP